ncbi:MAG: xanthomonadin transporter [Gammaproteobacteria bacterium]
MIRRARLGLIALWVLVLGALGFYVVHSLKVGTDLRSFIPNATTPDQKLLMNQIGHGPGARLLLVAISGTDKARLAALSKGLAKALRGDSRFGQVVNGDFDLSALDPKWLPYRYLFTSSFDHQRLDAAYLHQQLEQRLQDLASPAGGMLQKWLPRDPTLEVLKLAQRWTPAHAPETRDGVWFDKRGEALLLVQTQAAGFDPDAQAIAVKALRRSYSALPGSAAATLTLSGPGYFSVVISRNTRAQANWIGCLSTLGFILLLLLAYRSPSALVLAGLPIVSGALVGLTALILAFPLVNGITLAFGFTLLGVAQEYPIRLLSHRRAGTTALESMRGLWPLLLTAIASACIAYLAFYASGVPGLQQLAVFTITGLMVAGFSTRYLLARVLPARFIDSADAPGLALFRDFLDRLPRPRWLPWIIAVGVGLALWLAPGVFWQKSLGALTPLPPKMVATQTRLAAALGAPDARYLLLLKAKSAQGVLQLSEKIAPQMRTLESRGVLADVELPSRYLPSIATQRARQGQLPDRAQLTRIVDQASAGLPFRKGLFKPFIDDVETVRHAPPVTPRAFADSPLGQRLNSMLVQQGARWVGLATLSGVNDPAAFAVLNKETDGQVSLLDIKAASESLVSAYRVRILQALAVAALLLALTVTFALRSIRRAWHVLAPMTLATFLVLAVERLAGIEISLFHLIALILAAGLGLHYALFFERDTGDPAEQRRTLHATVVCVLSALLVFGMLVWSTIPVLRAIGLTVALGVAFHFCLSILMAPHAHKACTDDD